MRIVLMAVLLLVPASAFGAEAPQVHPVPISSGLVPVAFPSAAPTATSSACTVTLSGAATGTFACKTSVVWARQQNNNLAVALLVTGPAPLSLVEIAIQLPVLGGCPSTGVYTQQTAGVQAAFAVQSSSQATWSATTAGQVQPQGSFRLSLSHLFSAQNASGCQDASTTAVAGNNPSQPTLIYNAAHGVISATLPALPKTSASGTVTLSASF